MAPDQGNRKVWETPSLTVYGSVKEITQGGAKDKTWGGGDDVIINDQSLLSNAGS